MNLTSPSQVRALLAELGFRPSRLLGQNFLIDRNILDIIIKAAELGPGDHVLEVGPGLGVVTERLLDCAGQVTAVEKDKRLYHYLTEKFKDRKNFRLINADMLDVNADELADAGMNKVVSNLPYSVGSRILVDMVMARSNPCRMVVTVQLEVAQRLSAQPHGKEYGVLSVWAQYGYDVEVVKRVSPGCFWPMPEVTSAIVSMKKHDRFQLKSGQRKLFFEVTKQVFAHRRKQLATSLCKVDCPGEMKQDRAAALLAGIGVDPMARPENLGVAEWCALVKALARD